MGSALPSGVKGSCRWQGLLLQCTELTKLENFAILYERTPTAGHWWLAVSHRLIMFYTACCEGSGQTL
jgi:hypothetical protein